MTTSQSPVEELRSQAIQIVRTLKAGSIQTKDGEKVQFAVCQDDKTIVLTWTWKFIHNTASKELIDAILKEMRS